MGDMLVKKLLVAILFLVLAAIVGLSIYVYTIDWNKHKSVIAQQFLDATGKKIVFEGPVSFQIFPSPYLRATNVKIYNSQIMDKPLVEASDLVANLSLFPLLKKQFNVQRMEMQNPKINFELQENGSLNWKSNLSSVQRQKIEAAKISLNSVSVTNATVNFEDVKNDINLQLENLSGEIIAQSVFGPFRFEGSYTKDNNLEGFAISIGKLSDTLATSLNLVITHPITESYVRFDGSFMLDNKVLNGNVIIESKKLSPFLGANFKNLKVPAYFDYPLALTSDIDFNERQLSLSNIVVRYGETQGAGNVSLSFANGSDGEKPRVDSAFDFTDLNLDPIVEFVKGFFIEYNNPEKKYNPNFPFDMLTDVKSMRTMYNNQQIKNFEVSFDVVDNELNINSFKAELPGTTSVYMKGALRSVDDAPYYKTDISIKSSEILKALKWLNIAPEVVAASTYRKAEAYAGLEGTFDKIYISPLSLTLDRSNIEGEVAIKRGERKDIMLKLNADMINFDNYFAGLASEDTKKSWVKKMKMHIDKFTWLNDLDMQIEANAGVAIYEATPFENIELKANLLNGKLDIEELKIGSTANANIDIKGGVSGFGSDIVFDELSYEIKTSDVNSLIEKTGIEAPDWDYKKLRGFSAVGVVNGGFERYATSLDWKLENLEIKYNGHVDNINDMIELDGNIDVFYPSFTDMLEMFGSVYQSSVKNMGDIKIRSKIKGNQNDFVLTDLNANIGTNDFSGNLDVKKTDFSNPKIKADLSINKFEIDRFLNKNNTSASPQLTIHSDRESTFWPKPEWSKKLINYDFYQTFNVDGRFEVKELSYLQGRYSDAVVDLDLEDGVLLINSFRAQHLDGNIDVSAELKMRDKPSLSLNIKAENINTDRLGIGGKLYAINGGTADFSANVFGNATSENDLFSSISGKMDMKIKDFHWKGINLTTIYADIIKRESNEGLSAMVQKNLSSGTTSFANLNSVIDFTNGTFEVKNMDLTAKEMKVRGSGSGNLRDWTMNLLFGVKYSDPVYLPGFEFATNGNINSPVVTENVKDLFNLYQLRQDKKEAAKKAEEAKIQQRLNNKLEEYKSIAETMIKYVHDVLEPEILNAQKKTLLSENANIYVNAQQQIGAVVAELTQVTLKMNDANITDNDLVQVEAINAKQMSVIENIKKDLATARLNDVKHETDNLYQQIVEYYNKSKALSFKYNSIKNKQNEKLFGIVSDYNPNEDENIVGWQNFIDDKNKQFEKKDNVLLDKMIDIKNLQDIDAIDNYNQELLKLADMLASDIKDVEQSILEYEDYFTKKVDAQIQLYNDKLRKEEIERKVEENTGYINIKKSGRKVTIKRDIEDIEKAEEMTADKVIGVIDFSKPKNIEEKQNNKNNVVKRGRQKIN
ncbi:MAG: AsmA family protein [Alphaproteobacteria bacterium]|nr:AsmA family protein [Alphaproteobacteria bacterium]